MSSPRYMEGLTAFERAVMAYYMPSQIFAVISWGCAATNWAAKVLNSHPEIFCVHAANMSWQRYDDPGSQRLDGLPYMRVVANMGHGHTAAGDVHGVSRHHVPKLKEAFGDIFNAAVLVRDPLPRVLSHLALFESFKEFDAWDLSYADHLIEANRIVTPASDSGGRMFVHIANMLNAVLEEQAVGRLFRCEDLTSRVETITEFVDILTAGKVSVDSDWLRYALQMARVNVRSGESKELTPWQVDVLKRIVRPDAWQAYAQLGYSLPSFLR